MTITLTHVDFPKTARTVTSKYDFDKLTVGGPAMLMTDVIDRKKATSKMTSALVAYKKRTGDKSKFSVRGVRQEDGTDAVACWKIADAPAA